MRYSTNPKLQVADVLEGRRRAPRALRHDDFFAQISDGSKEADRRGGVLLAGGTSPADLAVRRAQSHLRLDRLPSYWSHAAIILHWPDGARLDQVIGAEVTLTPEDAGEQVPERNGVTLFRLSRYRDHKRWPSLAFGTLINGKAKVQGKKVDAECKDRIVNAVLEPCRDRVRYPLWEWLGPWRSFVQTNRDNPLLQRQALPSAALCDYAYGAAGIDLTPGAEAPDTCPEMLWSTLLYWYRPFGGSQAAAKAGPTAESSGVSAWLSLTREDSLSRTPLSSHLGADFTAAQGS